MGETKPNEGATALEIETLAKQKAINEERAKFLSLSAFTPETKFIDVMYSGKGIDGRTVIALGNFTIHIRSTGHKIGKIWDEKLGVNIEGEAAFDDGTIRLRHDVCGIDFKRRFREKNEIEALIEGSNEQSTLICHVIIVFRGTGSFELNGLPEDTAQDIRGMIYNWMVGTY